MADDNFMEGFAGSGATDVQGSASDTLPNENFFNRSRRMMPIGGTSDTDGPTRWVPMTAEQRDRLTPVAAQPVTGSSPVAVNALAGVAPTASVLRVQPQPAQPNAFAPPPTISPLQTPTSPQPVQALVPPGYTAAQNAAPASQQPAPDYDMAAAQAAGVKADANGHWPDTYKLPNHITFSTDSKYHGVDGNEGGKWAKQSDGTWSFTPGATNLKNYTPQQLQDYFDRNEKGNKLILPNAPSALGTSGNSKPLGSLTAKYESSGDPGMAHKDNIGWSYGKYQFNSRGSLNDFFRANPDYAKQFAGLNPESPEFAQKWRQVAQSDPKFADAQQKTFIDRAQPLMDQAKTLGFQTDNRGVKEAILSASIQHGKANRIVQAAASTPGFKDMSPQDQLKTLYSARSQYVANLSTIDNGTRQAVLGRYPHELRDALNYSRS